MASWLDKMISRVRNADSDEDARKAVGDYIDPATGAAKEGGDGDDTHIHLHMNKDDPDNNDPDPDNDGDNGTGGLSARVDQLEQMVQQLLDNEEEEVELEEPDTQDARRFKLRRGSKLKRTKDEDAEMSPERNPEMMGETDLPGIEDLDKRMAAGDKTAVKDRKALRLRDSADMEDIWQDTIASAEIIIPGFKIPTFDARLTVDRTRERLCALRRRVMDAAFKDDEVRPVIEDVVGIKTADGFKRLTCDSLKMAFNATASSLKASHSGMLSRSSAGTDGKTRDNRSTGAPSIAEMQKANKEFWNSQNSNGARR